MDKISTFRKLNKASQILEMLEILVSACETSGKKLPLEGVMHNIKISKDEVLSVLKDFEEPRALVKKAEIKVSEKSKKQLGSENSLKLESNSSSNSSSDLLSEFALSVRELPKDADSSISMEQNEKLASDEIVNTRAKNQELEVSSDSSRKKVSISDRIRAIPRVRTFNIND